MTRILETEGLRIDEGKCVGCGICADLCPHGVLRMELRENKRKNESKWLARINESVVCRRCGLCERECRVGAITL